MRPPAGQRASRALAWGLAGLFAVLAYASLTGSGHGVFGSGLGRSPVWPWVLLMLGVAAILLILLGAGARRGSRGEPDEA